MMNRLSKEAADGTTVAAAVAEGAIKAVHVVQAFGAAQTLSADHFDHLSAAMRVGVKKALAGAVLLGSIYFVALVFSHPKQYKPPRLIVH